MRGRLRDRVHRFFRYYDDPVDHSGPTEEVDNVSAPFTSPPLINDALPNELLGTIFMVSAERTLSAFRDVLSISHTCSQWRQVALDCPGLWTNYPFLHTIQDAGVSRLLLERCGSLKLNVGWDRVDNLDRPSSHRNHELFDLEGESIGRFRSYSILLSPAFIQKAEVAWLPWTYECPTESLEELVLDTGDLFRRYKFPWKMVDHDIPSLRILRLRSTWFDLSTILSGNLHTLDIALPSHAKPWSTKQWMSFLQGCRNLTHLSLNLYNIPGSAGASVGLKPPSKESTLPSLSVLTLATPISFCTAFFNMFGIPSIRALGITWPDRDVDGDIHRTVSNVMVPLMLRSAVRDNRMQICPSDVNGKVTIGFTPGNRLLDLPHHNWGRYALEHFGSGRGGALPNDYFQLRMKRGAWRLGQLLPYWSQVARQISTLHVDASCDDPIYSPPIREFLLPFTRKDTYTIWDYKF